MPRQLPSRDGIDILAVSRYCGISFCAHRWYVASFFSEPARTNLLGISFSTSLSTNKAELQETEAFKNNSNTEEDKVLVNNLGADR
jgi:hypothetical protein